MANPSDGAARSILPIPDRPAPGLDDLRREGPGHRRSRRSSRCCPPEGAPNVLIVLLDDVGFGASSAFGGPVPHARRPSGWRPAGCGTTGSTPRRCARRRARRC